MNVRAKFSLVSVKTTQFKAVHRGSLKAAGVRECGSVLCE